MDFGFENVPSGNPAFGHSSASVGAQIQDRRLKLFFPLYVSVDASKRGCPSFFGEISCTQKIFASVFDDKTSRKFIIFCQLFGATFCFTDRQNVDIQIVNTKM
jgi:hypothetical protein